MFRRALSFGGFDVREAGDGLEALRALDVDPPDLVILDLGLPLVRGEVVRQEIAAHAHTRRIPIVVVTGAGGALDHLDVNCVLRKPVSPDELVNTARACLASGAGSATA
jgi:DNA-binding response OmpR family regulator